MPEEITQKLGFDASAAITSLTNLNNKLREFRQGLQATSGGLRKFEANATKAVATFNTLGMSATKAAASISALRVASGGAVPPQIAAQAAAASAAMNKLGASAVTAQTKLKGVGTSAATGAAAMGNLSASAATAAASVNKSSATTVTAANKTSAALTKTGKAGAEAAQTIGISWKTIGRIILAQGVIRGLSLIVRTFQEAQVAAREFSLRVGEISTIAGGALGSINEISAATLELSRNLGIATDEVAEGLYQTLSNQVVEAGEAIRFETTAAKLSITTNSQLKESINALSSVMNSYQLDISEVDEVSAVLFKTIELGRLRMGEFGDVLGRVTPLTAALGIGYKEMAASLAALTQKGVPAHTAITQLTAVTQKLLRPTDKLQALYEEWGVETGPEAIRRFGGLRGVLLKMREATAGNEKEFAALFGRVRSMVGGMNLTTDAAKALTFALAAMQDPTADLDAAFARMESTIGRRSVKAWDDLDVSVHKAGETFLRVTTPMVEVLATVARNSDFAIAALVGLGVGAILVSGKLAIAGAAVLGFNTKLLTLKATMLTMLPIVAAIAVAIAAIVIKKAVLDSLDTVGKSIDRLKDSEEAMTSATEALSKARIKATKQEVLERTALLEKFITAEETILRRSTELFIIESKAVAEVLKDTITDLENKRLKALKVVRDAVTGMDDAIKSSQQIIKETQEAISKFDFERGIKHLNEQQKLWANIARTEKRATKAANAYTAALANEEDVTGARRLSKIAEANARQNLADAERLNNVWGIAQAERLLSKILNARIRGEMKFSGERKALETAEKRLALKRNEEASERYKALLKLRGELIKPFKDGKLKEPSVLEADLKRAKALDGAIAKALKQATDFDFVKSLKIEDFSTKLATEMENAVRDASFQWDAAVSSLEAQVAAGSYKGTLVLTVDDDFIRLKTEKFGETSITNEKELDERRQVAEETLAAESEAQATIADTSARLSTNLRDIEKTLSPSVWTNWLDGFRDANEEIRQAAGGPSIVDGQVEVAQILHDKFVQVGESLEQATEEARSLTQEEKNQVNGLRDLVIKAKSLGVLSNNRLTGVTKLTHQYAQQSKLLDKLVESQKVLDRLGTAPGTSRKVLKGLEGGSREFNNQQRQSKKTTAELKDEIKASVDAMFELLPAGKEYSSILGLLVNSSESLATNTERILAAQEELARRAAEAKTKTPAAAPKIDTPEISTQPLDNLTKGIEATTEATKPLIDGIKEVKTLSEDVPNYGIKILNGVTQATKGTGTLGEVVKTLGNRFIEVAGKVNTISTSVVTTTGHVEGTTIAAGFLSEGMSAVAIETQSTTRQMALLEQQALATARAIASISTARGSAGAAFHGGPAANYMAAGGPTTRGKDTIPVMAAPGEFFVNARNSRRFASELQAMNTGREPIFRDKGGSVTNVGDINVSVTQGGTASNTARQIATSLRRELRRGTSRL